MNLTYDVTGSILQGGWQSETLTFKVASVFHTSSHLIRIIEILHKDLPVKITNKQV